MSLHQCIIKNLSADETIYECIQTVHRNVAVATSPRSVDLNGTHHLRFYIQMDKRSKAISRYAVWEQRGIVHRASLLRESIFRIACTHAFSLVNLKAINRNYQKSVCDCKWKIFWKCNQNNLKLCNFLYFM